MNIAYTFTGEEERNRDGRYIIPRDATHFTVHPSVKVIPVRAFCQHQNIVELVCHDGVIKIESEAFWNCTRLRRVIIRGVKRVEDSAFGSCPAVTYVECPKLERIGHEAFFSCGSLININLPSVKIVSKSAFSRCAALMEAKFGKELQSIKGGAFYKCFRLKRITIPLKNGLFTSDDTFQECAKFERVDLIEGDTLHDTAASLLLEEGRNDVMEEIDSIKNILPNARAGKYDEEDHDDWGEKALVIREWIRRVLNIIINYKAQHPRLLNDAASALQLALPNDIVTNHVVPFLELPLHTFDGEDEDEEESIDSDDGSEYTSSEDEDRDGEEEEASVDGTDDEDQQQNDGDEGGMKRRKTTTNGNEESDR